MLYINWVELEACMRMSALKCDMSQPSKIFIARENMHKSQQYQISRYQIVNDFKFLKSDTPYCFAYISAPFYRTEKFLYSRQSYESHLLNKLCPSMSQPSSIFVTKTKAHFLWTPCSTLPFSPCGHFQTKKAN